MCCCSGRTRSVMDAEKPRGGRGLPVERTGYERVGATPLMGQHQQHPVPMQTYGVDAKPGYEPMRHGRV
jgi:hypothetical protein